MLYIRSYLKISSETYIFNFVHIYPDSLYWREQGCEDPWLFFGAKRGPRAKTFGKHWFIAIRVLNRGKGGHYHVPSCSFIFLLFKMYTPCRFLLTQSVVWGLFQLLLLIKYPKRHLYFHPSSFFKSKLEEGDWTCPNNLVWYIPLNRMKKVQKSTSSNVTHHFHSPIEWNIFTWSVTFLLHISASYAV